MPVYFVTGKLGSGKSLSMAGRMREYLRDGRPVATNIHVFLEHMLKPKARDVLCYRLPAKPSIEHLQGIGSGNPGYDESRNGGLFLDECGTWLNSRGWADPSRQPFIDWMLHARKLGWDVYFLVQDISIIDKQARLALAEHVVWCRRMDRIPIPILSWIVKAATGYRLTFPKVHFAIVKYGDTTQHLTVDRWVYRGRDLYSCYDTKQVFKDDGEGLATYLTPWHLKGRYMRKRNRSALLMIPLKLLMLPLYVFSTARRRRLEPSEVSTVINSILGSY